MTPHFIWKVGVLLFSYFVCMYAFIYLLIYLFICDSLVNQIMETAALINMK